MKRVDEYITDYEANQFCANCNEICSRHCVVWRNALIRYDEEERKEKAGEEMATSEAALKAQKKYDESHKDMFKSYHLKFNKKDDAEVIFRLDTVPNKVDYIRQLIKKDIKGGN